MSNVLRYSTVAPASGEDDDFLRGLRAFCQAQRDANADPTLDTEGRMLRVAQRLMATEPPPSFMAYMQSISGVPQGRRYATLKAEAARHGDPGWSCPAIAVDDGVDP